MKKWKFYIFNEWTIIFDADGINLLSFTWGDNYRYIIILGFNIGFERKLARGFIPNE